MIDKNKIEDKDWQLLRENFIEESIEMDINDLAEHYVECKIKNIKEDERLDWVDNGILPCNQCNNFKDDCECKDDH